MRTQIRSHFFVIVATIIVAGSFIVSQKLATVIDPISLTLYRFTFATLLLAPFVLINKKFRSKILTTLPRGLLISLFYALYFLGLFKALETTSALNTGTLFTLVPLLTAILAIFFLKQKIRFVHLVSYIVGIVATCIVIFKGDLELFLSIQLNKGDIIFLFAILSMALYAISTKLVHREDDHLIVLVFTTLFGGVLWMFFALELLSIPLEWGKIKGDFAWYMFYLVVPSTLLTIYLYQKSTINLGPKKVMAYVYINPALIVLLLYIFEQETVSYFVLFGILVCAIATFILLFRD